MSGVSSDHVTSLKTMAASDAFAAAVRRVLELHQTQVEGKVNSSALEPRTSGSQRRCDVVVDYSNEVCSGDWNRPCS